MIERGRAYYVHCIKWEVCYFLNNSYIGSKSTSISAMIVGECRKHIQTCSR
jgi:hypothetical protein